MAPKNAPPKDVTHDEISSGSRVAAFFDFDKTILATDSLSKEALVLWEMSRKQRDWVLYLKLYFVFLFVVPLYQCGLVGGCSINRIYIGLIYRGLPVQRLHDIAKELYQSRLRHQLYPKMIELVRQHQKLGHLVIVVSASPRHLLLPFYHDYIDIIHDLETTEVEVNDAGRCTGRCRVCIGESKARAQERFAANHNINLSQSYAYSDHHHDEKFLEGVGTAIVVNPTPELERIAKKREWSRLDMCLESS